MHDAIEFDPSLITPGDLIARVDAKREITAVSFVVSVERRERCIATREYVFITAGVHVEVDNAHPYYARAILAPFSFGIRNCFYTLASMPMREWRWIFKS